MTAPKKNISISIRLAPWKWQPFFDFLHKFSSQSLFSPLLNGEIISQHFSQLLKRISQAMNPINRISSPLSQLFFHGLNTISEHKIGAHKYEQTIAFKIYSIDTFPSGTTDIFMRSIIQTTKTPLLKELQHSFGVGYYRIYPAHIVCTKNILERHRISANMKSILWIALTSLESSCMGVNYNLKLVILR